jgi:putative ABC transport system permease protein
MRVAFRSLFRRPGLTTVAVITFALGIGANTAIFSFVHGVLLKRLPYATPERVQLIYMNNAHQQLDGLPISVGDFKDIRDQAQSFEKVAAYTRGIGFTLPTPEGSEYLAGAVVTANFFAVLGTPPELGRTFQPGEDTEQASSMIVISDRMWRKYFNADPSAIGRTISFSTGPQTIVGVMSPDFHFPSENVDIWRNYKLGPVRGRGPVSMWAMGRLKPGIARAQADAELRTLGRQFEQISPLTNTGYSFAAKPIEDVLFGNVRRALYVLLAAVMFVLLIAGTNVTNLMLAQATAREKEVAIRAALGAGRSRIIQQLLTESLVLSLIGGAVGVVIANWSLRFFVALAPGSIPRLDQVSIDVPVLAFSAAVSVMSGVIFGLAPALQTRRVDLNSRLKDSDRGNTSGSSRRLRNALIVSEIALSLILLVGAGVVIRSFIHLRAVDTGFDATNVMALRVGMTPAKYDTSEKVLAFRNEFEGRVAALPGVQATGLTNSLPPIQNDLNDSFTIEGRPASDSINPPVATVLIVSPGYFKTLSIPVLRGRPFTDSDRAGSARVALINETLARRFFASEDPIGKRLRIGGADRAGLPWWEIVGVVKDVRYDGLTNTVDPAYYLPYAQIPDGGMDLVVKTAGSPQSLVATIRQELRALDPETPLIRVTTLEERMSLAVGEPRFQTLLLSAFAAIALVLAGVGVYGVLSYSVSLRTHEIGVRLSLGASRYEVLWMVIREGMLLAVGGVLAGLVAAFAATRPLQGSLFEISAHDPLTLVLVSVVMLAVAFFACFIPARRATRVDPLVALRHE